MALLHFLLFACIIPSIFADKIHRCSLSSKVISELENNYGVYIYDHSNEIIFNFEDIFAKIFSSKDIMVILHKASASFSGHIVSKGRYVGPLITANFEVKPIFVKRFEKVVDGRKGYQCGIINSDNFAVNLGLGPEESAIIIQLTEYCMQSLVCEQFGSIISDEFIRRERTQFENVTIYDNITNSNDVFQNTASNKRPLSCSKNSGNIYNPQDTINTLMDFGLSVLLSKFVNNIEGVFNIPPIFTDFSTGFGIFKTTGEVEAADGSFEDIRALTRERDLVFSNEGFKFAVGTTYKLSKAKLQFGRYKVRYGIIKINGQLSVDIDGIAISTKIAFDFNSKPCKAQLIHLEIDELGEIHVVFTGLGFMNKPVQSLIRWIIREKTFDSVRDIVAKKLEELNCEQYRPSIELA